MRRSRAAACTASRRGWSTTTSSANGLENATAGYDGWYVSPELTLGHRLALGTLADSHYALTPSLQVRYLYAGFDGYTEAGTTAPLTVGSRNTQNVEERAELKLTRTTQLAPASQLMVNLTGGAIGTQRVGGNAITATLLAQPLAFAVAGRQKWFGGFGGRASNGRPATSRCSPQANISPGRTPVRSSVAAAAFASASDRPARRLRPPALAISRCAVHLVGRDSR